MAKKDNFGAAMFDMFGVGKNANEQEAPKTEEVKKPAAEPVAAVKKEEKAAPAPAPIPAKPVYGKSVIAIGTTFEGNISTHGDLEVAGEFKGNIYSEGRVVISSPITGNIKADSIAIVGTAIQGDLIATGLVEMDMASSVTGNIAATNIVCAGNVTGDLDIRENLALSDTAVVNGNIKMSSMSVARGAKITGKLEMQA